MNWQNVVVITGGALVLAFALVRVERRALWAVIVFLVAPAVFLLVQWANVSGQWAETLIAFAVAGGLTGLWWLGYGRRLPAPTSDNIKVWGQEPAPKPKPPDVQAELQQLREERDQLAEELRRLKGGNHHGDE